MKNRIIFVFGRTISLLGTQLYNFVFALMVLYTTGSALNFAVTLLLEIVPRIVLSPVAGIVADRYDRKKILVYSDCISGAFLLGAYFIFENNGYYLYVIYIVTFILNSINTVFDVTMNASLERLFSQQGLETMCSINEAISSFVTLLAPTIGAIIYAVTSFRVFILLNGISFLLSAISEIFIEYPKSEQSIYIKRSVSEEMLETIYFLKRERVVFDLYFVALFINIFFGVAASLSLPIVLTKYVNMSEIEYGFIESLISIGMMFGAVIVGMCKTERKYKVIIASLMSEAISILLIAIPILFEIRINPFVIYCAISVLLGVSVSSVNINVRVLLQNLIPDKIKGKVLGTLSSLCMAAGPLSILVGAMYVENHNPAGLIVICGIGFIVLNIGLSFDKELQKV
ncbi:MFS-type transporter involved in bile tolerance, Atg22 family [Lachnospiraceae bacterium A10]|nr:MFS-type transporter involved in bile tolerance, Atg22 family [Lachnospiraceae bacterium A10]